MTSRQGKAFFEAQFRKQTRTGEFVLNPFEVLALPFVYGRALDLGCGLGNPSVESARRSCSAIALDGSPTAIAHVRRTAQIEGPAIEADQIDLSTYRTTGRFDTIVAIGLLMFFPQHRALELLDDVKAHVQSDGTAIVNVLNRCTTYPEMFEEGHYDLFEPNELQRHFAGWDVVLCRSHRFDPPGHTVMAFTTLVAKSRPGAS